MKLKNQVVAIDAGNTSIKVGFFSDGDLKKVYRIDIKGLKKVVSSIGATNAIVSSVLSKKKTDEILNLFESPIFLSNDTKLPIYIHYKTKNTLGVDRICNAVYAHSQLKKGIGVIIGVGTCIKFDVISKNGDYYGGSISPGIQLRYNSLNDYTGNLPRLEIKSQIEIVGVDTSTSIQSGVINGIQSEIKGFIDQYSNQFENLTFFITGGDAQYFEFHSKNSIFANENLTLLGLNNIYEYNA